MFQHTIAHSGPERCALMVAAVVVVVAYVAAAMSSLYVCLYQC
jgi:hypothetical protein